MRHISFAIFTAAVASCSSGTDVTQPIAAASVETAEPSYDIAKLPSLGGTRSRGNGINNLGWIAGFSNTPTVRHAALWRGGAITDLLTLGGLYSNVPWKGLNNRGMVVGISETADADSLNEDWSCWVFFGVNTDRVCRGFAWENGTMTAMPTLGGTHSFATGVNDDGQVVGWAETAVHDPTCTLPGQVLQFRAVVWEPKRGKIRQLRPFRDDATSAATAINDLGQVVGISGDCGVAVGAFSARHALLWENGGKPIHIGNFGGKAWNTPMAINNRGDVVGFSDRQGDDTGESNELAFIWNKHTGIKSLGVLEGDSTSEAIGINRQRQVVGLSCDKNGVCRGFLWQHGKMHNFKDLIPGFTGTILSAQDVNDDGVVTGRMIEQGATASVAFVATPKRGHQQAVED